MAGLAILQSPGYSQTRFQALSPSQTGIQFKNQLTQTESMNLFTNQYVTNGGGVATGDLNNDGLSDLYFVSNQQTNKLYLNEGALRFRDITEVSGTGGRLHWATGVTIVDVNGDGWNDIYVCYAGNYLHQPENLWNELYINQGDARENGGIPTFREQAQAYGLEGDARTMTATFFDYDRDNDLDVYLVNHPYNFFLPFDQRQLEQRKESLLESNRLLRNDNGRFTDVTKEAGLVDWAFSLSASSADLNEDGWPDLFVSNDFSEKDACYINNQDGTFTRKEDSLFFHLSNFSMGSEIADINNDLLPDLMVVDMMAEDNRRKKTNMSAMNPEAFWENVAVGEHYQYMQNVFQLNNGDGTFSDVAELMGVAYTDWSWSVMMADLDNDGWKDLYISNGLPVDARNSDAHQTLKHKHTRELRENWEEYLALLPHEEVSNYCYRNGGDLTFSNVTDDWGLTEYASSNGVVIADLDNDGDLDIVLNNLNAFAGVFENMGIHEGLYLQVEFNGPEQNPRGIGAKAILRHGDKSQTQTLSLARGYQSGGDHRLHFGLGDYQMVDQLEVIWPDGNRQWLTNVQGGQKLVVSYSVDKTIKEPEQRSKPLFEKASSVAVDGLTHRETPYDDYKKELLLPHKYSQLGPKLAVGDVNGDSRVDFYLPGASGFPGSMMLQTAEGTFVPSEHQPWSKDSLSEEICGALFDADADGDLDLYIGCGSNEWPANDPLYRDRYYLNDGAGQFVEAREMVPEVRTSAGCVVPGDMDGDGDLDLFIGGRQVAGKYPEPATSLILENKEGVFTNATDHWGGHIESAGYGNGCRMG